jgi:site-specific recombinase XerD
MAVPRVKNLPFFASYERFIQDSRRGKRLQPNGKRISGGTVTNYVYTLGLIKKFCDDKKFELRIRPARRLNARELEREKNYWKKFYKRFTDYLYDDCGFFDNYVGHNVKNIRTFFNYLNKDLALGVGDFHKLFYVRKEEIAIFPLMPEELSFLVYNKTFEDSLTSKMKEVKDFFVFGCTVALRFSDLASLKHSNIRIASGQYYLVVRSIKTNTDTLVKLPPYAVDIINKYPRRKRLLPAFNKVNLNKYIKQLLEQAGLTQPVLLSRDRRGRTRELKKTNENYRFCDVATTHTMRRTAITTMLSLGVSEQVVRKISGHAPGSKEFYRYVFWAQTYQDQEVDRMFARLEEKKLQTHEPVVVSLLP